MEQRTIRRSMLLSSFFFSCFSPRILEQKRVCLQSVTRLLNHALGRRSCPLVRGHDTFTGNKNSKNVKPERQRFQPWRTLEKLFKSDN